MDKILEKFTSIPTYYIEIGVFSEDTKRDEDVPEKKTTTKKLTKKKLTKKKFRKKEEDEGVTNAQLLFIHENGSYLKKPIIPKRPVLAMTIKHAKKEWVNNTIKKAIIEYVKSGYDIRAYENELKNLCMKMENYARDIIYLNDGRLVANSPSTIRGKKDIGNHPLFRTSQLARSISCRLIKS